jgi:hypothetical protein
MASQRHGEMEAAEMPSDPGMCKKLQGLAMDIEIDATSYVIELTGFS